MKRKLLLLIGSFAVLLGAFYVYQLTAAPEVALTPQSHRNANLGEKGLVLNPPATAGATSRPAEGDAGGGLDLHQYDKQGRLQGVYTLQEWDKRSDGTYAGTNPTAVLYQKDGQRIYLFADRGEVSADETAGGASVRNGKLWGNVEVYFDRGTAPDRPHPRKSTRERLQEEVVRIFTDHVFFDNDQLLITTEAKVTIFSREADIVGRGLTIKWREAPRELVHLRMDEGEMMTIHNGAMDLDVLSLSDDATETGGTADPSVPAPVTPPAPLTPSAPAADTAEAKASNVYAAVFNGQVRVDSGNRHLAGADRLRIEFSFLGDLGESLRDGRKEKAPSGDAPAPAPEAPVAGGESADAPPAEGQKDGSTVITWSGPLELRPLRHDPDASEDRFHVTAEGKRVVLWDDESAAVCRELRYRQDPAPAGAADASAPRRGPVRSGELLGTPDAPAYLVLPDGQEAVSATIRFDASNIAHLDGPGHMRRHRDPNALAQRRQALQDHGLVDVALAPPEGDDDLIVWKDHATARIEPVTVIDKDGTPRETQSFQEGHFVGEVQLRSSQGGDRLDCDELFVYTKRSAAGRDYLSSATATGRVRGQLDDTQILADTATVVFKEPSDQPPDRPAKRKGERGAGAESDGPFANADVSTVTAAGSVKLTKLADPQDPNSLPTVVTCDLAKLVAADHTADLYGVPAVVTQGGNRIQGDHLRLVEHVTPNDPNNAIEGYSIDANGPGELAFLTDKGLRGETLTEKRAIQLTWKGGMEGDSRTNEVHFARDVKLRSGNDRIDCGAMTVRFEPAPQGQDEGEHDGAAPAPKDGSTKRASRLFAGMDDMSGRRIAAMTAREGVNVYSHEVDAQGTLLRLLHMTVPESFPAASPRRGGRGGSPGPSLVYDAATGAINVDGPGTFAIADYRPPESRDAKPSEAMGDDIERPFQSYFQWSELMSLEQKADPGPAAAPGDPNAKERKARNVTLVGNVETKLLSGRFVGRKSRYPLPEWGTLTRGRSTSLSCSKLFATFADPDAKDDRSVEGQPTEGPGVGEVQSFLATGDVHLRDGQVETRDALCHALSYDRKTDIVRMLGSAARKAVLTLENLQTRKSYRQTADEFLWYRQTDRIDAKNPTGGGVR